ncbi:hypothetical protein QQS21_002035 [Conoideocrella luteorostrata]|uniref:Aminoglycoside phosphotransferase domain-containing protein n=1 Tax=Conoideocrella luteorostrata TaxID=1105319 RepID=A0AAJ0CYF5_9HYPO|nr:hypothetical protein QQS21_002035 [Conoideocrella luteorostrata]
MTPADPIDQYEAADALLKYVYSGILGPTKGMAVYYAVMHTTNSTFTFSATLRPPHNPPNFVDRYQIEVDRRSGRPSASKMIEITNEDMQKAILAVMGEKVASTCRFTHGGFSISYKVTMTRRPDTTYIVQPRFHGNVASMDALIKFVRANNSPEGILMPTVYSIPGEAEHQRTTGFGRKITQFVPGVIAERVYPDMSHAERLELGRKMALAWQACWNLPLPSPRQIGGLMATDNDGNISLTVGPDRHFSLGGPFTSVRERLRARLQHAIGSLQITNGINDYKEENMAPIQTIVDNRLDKIPQAVEECPIVALHVDMGVHNMLVSADDHKEINAIIDWELCASAPFLAAHEFLEGLFRMGASNGSGVEYPRADQRRSAFCDAIRTWKRRWESPRAKDCMEWLRFALFMQPEYCSNKLPRSEKWQFRAENRRVVEAMIEKYE